MRCRSGRWCYTKANRRKEPMRWNAIRKPAAIKAFITRGLYKFRKAF